MKCKDLKECIDRETTVNINQERGCVRHDACIQSSDTRAKVACREKGKKYTLDNTLKKFVVSYKMDGGVITVDRTVPDKTGKCDYLYILYDEKQRRDAILTELKGTDVSKALKQIKGTLELFPDVFKACAHVYGRAVVTSSRPNLMARPKYVNLAKRLEKNYHGNLKIREREFVEKDTELEKGR